MLIDYTYFIGKINLPQRTIADGQAELSQFIQQYEPKYLQCVLGFDLWQAFIAGLSEPDPAEKWLRLLNGANYTYKTRNGRWQGFVPLSDGSQVNIDTDNDKFLTVGGPGDFDPATGSSSFTVPPEYQGVPFSFEIRGTGLLDRGVEYTVNEEGDVITMIAPPTLNVGGVLILRKGPSLVVSSTTTLKISPIANYVYYQFKANGASDTVGVGEVVSDTDNSKTVNGMRKMITAWNEMVEMNVQLYRFLSANKDDYPEWKPCTNCRYWWAWDYPLNGYYCSCQDVCNGIFRKKNILDL